VGLNSKTRYATDWKSASLVKNVGEKSYSFFSNNLDVRISNFQAKHPRSVDRITSIDNCSQTQILIFLLLRGVST